MYEYGRLGWREILEYPKQRVCASCFAFICHGDFGIFLGIDDCIMSSWAGAAMDWNVQEKLFLLEEHLVASFLPETNESILSFKVI